MHTHNKRCADFQKTKKTTVTKQKRLKCEPASPPPTAPQWVASVACTHAIALCTAMTKYNMRDRWRGPPPVRPPKVVPTHSPRKAHSKAQRKARCKVQSCGVNAHRYNYISGAHGGQVGNHQVQVQGA